MSHKPQEILFVTNDGLVMTNGYSNKLSKGVIALVDKGGENTKDGIPVTATPSTEKGRKFELRLGVADYPVSRNRSDKSWDSRPFELKEIVDIRVSAPSLVNSVDEIWLGYDGINADTAIVLEQGETAVVDITLEGDGLGVLGYVDSKATFKFYITAPLEGAFTMQQLVEEAIEKFKKTKLYGGVPVTEFVDITPINSEQPKTVTGTTFTIYELNVPMEGISNNIAQVKAQYPTLDVKFDSEIGGVSKFYVAKEGAVPAPFNVTKTTITLDCGEYDGSADTITTIAWTTGEVCTATKKTYTLQLPDTECGEQRLTELQAFYPELTITAGESTNCQTVYTTTVMTNFVCEECSPILRDTLVAEAPIPFEFTAWEASADSYNASALMGIRIKGKEFVVAGGEEYFDTLPMFHSFVKISATGGYPTAQYLNFGELGGIEKNMTTTRKSWGTRPEALGMDYFTREERTRVYFTRTQKLLDNNFGNALLGNESLLKPLSQYVMYTIQVERGYFAQSFSQKNIEQFRYNILVEVGKHKKVEAFVNGIATVAGLATVKAYEADV